MKRHNISFSAIATQVGKELPAVRDELRQARDGVLPPELVADYQKKLGESELQAALDYLR